MRSLYIQLIIVLLYVSISHIFSGNSLSNNWLLGYVLFLSPFVILLICSRVSSLRLAKIYSYVSLLFVLIASLLLIINQSLFIVPALALILLVFSLIVLVVTLLFKGLKYASSTK